MGWDKTFEMGDEIKESDEFVKLFYEKHKSELKNKKLLDLGCGTGRNALFFAEKGLDVYALDKSKTALDILQKKTKLDKTIYADISKIPSPDNFFDIIISTWVFHHGKIEQIKTWLKETTRILKKEGYFVVDFLSDKDDRSKTGKEIEPNTRINIIDAIDPEVPHHFFSEDDLRDILKDFEILESKERISKRFNVKEKGEWKHLNVVARLKGSFNKD